MPIFHANTIGRGVVLNTPAADATAGFVVQTDGSGNLSLAVVGPGGIDLTANYSWTGDHSWNSDIQITGDIIVSGTVDGVDIAALSSAVALNTAKTTNATHTGEVTGDTALTAQPEIISNRSLVTAVATDQVLILDATDGTLKKADVDDFISAASVDESADYDWTGQHTWSQPLLGSAANTVDLGSTAVEFKNAYLGGKAYFGTSQQGYIDADSSSGGQLNLASNATVRAKLNGTYTQLIVPTLILGPTSGYSTLVGTTGALKIKSASGLSVRNLADSADTAITASTFNGVALTTGGSASNYLDEQGNYTTPSGGASELADLSDVDSSVGSPSDGDIIVYRSAGSDWVLETKPAGGSNPAMADITDVTIDSVADNEVLAYDSGSGDWINQTASEAGLATSAQGSLADSAVQPGDNVSDLTNDAGYITATLTDEEVQDLVGGMVAGNTETLIAVTYDDGGGKLNFVVDDDLSQYDNSTSQFSTASSTESLTNKTIDGDNNTISNLDLGNEVDWAAAADVSDRTAFASGDKVLIFEAGVGMRKVDYDDLPGAGGGMTNFSLAGDSGTPQTISDGNTLDVAGGTGISTVAGATDTVTVSIDSTVVTLDGSQTLTNKTFDANGTGNSLSNVDVADLADGTDGELITWDATGSPTTVAVGTSGQVLTSNGAGAAPTFEDAAGGGNVSNSGTPVDNQIAIWASATTLEGDSSLTFDTSTDKLTIGAGGLLNFGAVTILDDSSPGAMELANIDSLDGVTTSTIEGAMGTCSNLVSIQGYDFTLTGDFVRVGAHNLEITTSGTTTITLPESGTLLANVVEDTTPQLGGELDAQANTIGFTETTSTPSGTTQTIDLTNGNHQTLDVGSATGALTVTFTPPTKSCAGTLIVIQDAAPKDISWATTGKTTTWLGTEPTWSSDTSKTRIVSWRYDGTTMWLMASGTN